MLLFRSEEHARNWCSQWRVPLGALLSLDQGWRLAQAWYATDPRDNTWRRKTVDEIEKILSELELTGSYWNLRV